ncbi:MAG TPA: hypothetical protein VGA70_03515 [Longimicrobiales bacterium]|jgi:hypothetical protein
MIPRWTVKLLIPVALGLSTPNDADGQRARDAFVDPVGVWETHDTYYPTEGVAWSRLT